MIQRIFICILLCTPQIGLGYKAVCKVPVADLLGESMMVIKSKPDGVHHYSSIPYAENGCSFGCPRLHQLLFNEIVEVHQVADNEALIEIPNVYYHTATNMTPQTTYWTSVRNLIALSELEKKGINLTHAFPQPISYQATKNSEPIIVLTRPHYDPTTHTVYSAGTRFKLAQTPENNKPYTAYVFNPHTETIVTVPITRLHGAIQHASSPEHAQNNFVQLVRSWAHVKDGVVPYVWGGCSIGLPCKNTFEKKENNGKTYFTWRGTHAPKQGVDCAGLVARAAQIAGLPYFFKNTTTLAHGLQELPSEESPVNGDLIWIPGHVMVISDVTKSLLVEARHYNHGYGIVHEITLKEQFQNIETYKDLVYAHTQKRGLRRLNKDGRVVQTIPEFKILRLASVWRS
ncbi:hypothetical protein JW872_02875 [Candidatus Babeliales bacterium]|nr:hypothetical protein [Candidatus Babeliales bacterium]